MPMRTITFENLAEPQTYSQGRDVFDSDTVKVDADIVGFNESGCTVTIGNKMYFLKQSGNKMHFDGDCNKLAVMYNLVPDNAKVIDAYAVVIRIWKETNEMKATYIKSNKDLQNVEKITCNIDVK